MRKVIFLLILFLFQLPLLAENEDFFLLYPENKWFVTSNISYFSQQDLLPDSLIKGYKISLGGTYSPLNKLWVNGKLFFSSTYNNYPHSRWLYSGSDLRFSAVYKFFFYKKLNLYLFGTLWLFAPVKGSSRLSDTSSYRMDILAEYKWGKIKFIGDLGYFYDRRINFTPAKPTIFEQLAWEEIDYTWTPLSLNLSFMGNGYTPYLKLYQQVLYNSGISFFNNPVFLYTGINFKIYRGIYLQHQIRWKLFSKHIDGYPDYPNTQFYAFLTFTGEYFARPIPKKPLTLTLRIRVKGVKEGSPVTIKIGPLYTQTQTTPVFLFPSIKKGSYPITITSPNYQTLTTEVTVSPSTKNSYQFALKEKIKKGGILGYVRSNEIGVKDAVVRISAFPNSVTKTDSSGIFDIKGLSPGVYTLSVTSPYYQPVSQFVEVPSGKIVVVRISLQELEYPHGILILHIKGNKGKLLNKFNYKIKASRYKVLEEENGFLKLYLAPGDVEVDITVEGYKEKIFKVSIDEGDNIETSLHLVRLKK